MSQPTLDYLPHGRHTITPHIVVRDAARATEWYTAVFDAKEHGRIVVPGGKLMQVELWFGDSAVMLADEFTELGAYRAGASRRTAEQRGGDRSWAGRADPEGGAV